MHSAGITAPRMISASNVLVGPPSHRHAHRRMCRSIVRLFTPPGPDQWAIHVPSGKLKTERWVPVDAFVCQLVQRIRFLPLFRFLTQMDCCWPGHARRRL